MFSKVFLKISLILVENTGARYNVNVKVWFYASNLHFNLDSYKVLYSSESCRGSKNTFLLEHFWASASEFIFDIFKSNKFIQVRFLFTLLYSKNKTNQKNRVALNPGNPRFVLQWTTSFFMLIKLLLSAKKISKELTKKI